MDPDRFRKTIPVTHVPPHAEEPLQPLPHSFSHHQKKKKGSKGVIYGVIIVLLVAAAGIAAALLLIYKPAKKPAVNSSNAAVSQNAPAQSTTNNQPAVATSSYTSVNYGVTFNYPKDWIVTDSGNAPLSVSSPSENLTAANGSSVLGQIIFTIAPKGSLPQAFGNSSVAVISSQKINYTQPSSSQRAQTYLTFVQYPATTTKGGLDAIFITGNLGYTKDQTIPPSDISAVDPLVSVTFVSCSSDSCPPASRKPMTVASSQWQNQSFSAPILAILTSLSFS